MSHIDDCDTQEVEITGVFSENEFQKDHYKIVVEKDTVPSLAKDSSTEWFHACLIVGTEWGGYHTVAFESDKNSKQNTLDSLIAFRDDINKAIETLKAL